MEKTFAKVVPDIRHPGSHDIVETVIVAQQDFVDTHPEPASFVETWEDANGEPDKRYNFASIGYHFDKVKNVFYAPQPFPSWVLDAKFQWQPPVPAPKSGFYVWDEKTTSWVDPDA